MHFKVELLLTNVDVPIDHFEVARRYIRLLGCSKPAIFMIFIRLTSELDVLVNSEREGLGNWLSPPPLRTSRTLLSFLSCRK